VVLPPPCPQPIQPIDFAHAGELIGRALSETRTYLKWLEQTDSTEAGTAPAERLVAHSQAQTAESFAAPARS
jgi:hypothetical protein